MRKQQYDPIEWLKTARKARKGPVCSICCNEAASKAIVETVDLIDSRRINLPISALVPMVEEYFNLVVAPGVMHHHVKEHVRRARVKAAKEAASLEAKLNKEKMIRATKSKKRK